MTRNFTFFSALLIIAGCTEPAREPDAGNPKLEGETIVFPAASPQFASLGLAQAEAASPIRATLTGRLVWDEDHTARLYPAYSGKVTQILVKPGDAVRAGQTMALLGSPDFGQTQSDASRAAADFALAGKSLERARALFDHGVMAQKELQVAQAEYQKADAEHHRTQGRLKLYGDNGTVDQRFALASPIAGTVVERNINPGQELRSDMASANTPAMFVVTDPARLWVQLDASEKDLPFVRKGVSVALKSPAYPDVSFPARIETVADFVDPTTRTIKVRGTVDNAAKKLKGEMFITAEVPRTMAGALQVPAMAVFLRGDKNYVFVAAAGNRITRRQVGVGPAQDTTIIVLSGLTQGETVVTSGNLLLQQMLAAAPLK
jgi:membrane fusion protein, heavy metal efflux system